MEKVPRPSGEERRPRKGREDFVAQLFDVGAQQRNGRFKIAVEENVALRGGEQERGELFGADVVDVADYIVRREGLVPIGLVLRRERDGGETVLGNLALVCQYHHDVAIHRQGWRLILHPDGTTEARSPDGKQVLYSHAPPAPRAA